MSPEEFMERVSVADSGCWQWLQRFDWRGYGRSRWMLAHRVAYEVFVGPIPAEMTVDHICFNTGCVNPEHLQLLSHVDNARRQRSALATHCLHGHAFDEQNTYMRTAAAKGRRQCRACNREAVRRYKDRKSA